MPFIKPLENNGATQQINGREGETATLYERRSLNSKLYGGGFAPRQLNRYIAFCDYEHYFNWRENEENLSAYDHFVCNVNGRYCKTV